MSLKRISLFLLLVLSFCSSGLAQNPEVMPIKWRMIVKMISPKEGTVTLRAIIDPGWHLYGTKLPKDGPVPTTFDFSDSKGVVFVDDFKASTAPEAKKDSSFGLILEQWNGNVSFTRNFRLKGNISDAEISGTIKFMGCNDVNCMPPKTVNLKTKPKPFVAK